MNKNKTLANIEVIKETINKEKAVIKLYQALNLQPSDESPLSISYCNEVMALTGLPDEKDLSLYQTTIKNWDEFYNDYTAMIYGDKAIDQVLTLWGKKITPIALPYNAKDNKKLITEYLTREQKLVKSLKLMGVMDKGPLADLVKDYNLVLALIDKDSADTTLQQDLYDTLENGAAVSKFVKKWV